MASILVAEDEADLAAIVADYITAAGHQAQVLTDGREAWARVQQQMPDLIVLDLMLPGMDGLSLCKAVRERSDVPIIMVTARVEEIDRLHGLDVGADDYLCKPFSPRELVARIKAVLRRRLPVTAAPEPEPAWIVSDETRSVTIRSQSLQLTPTEYALFAAMARRPGAIWSRAQLLDLIRGDALDVTDRAIDSHVKNLRRKIAVHWPEADVVQSVYGLGYRVELPAPPAALPAPSSP
ncbi:response regulator [Ideonella azotifigens]|uniref:Response regulator n=1 Tax=Ideonella azotifigens TaxID=513160 RepID=A0ABN1K0N9_9BURK|nr:response regulator [Ideonella azotifigens]MCD2341562.1 response regulator [Ideonella azotifigens]